MAQQQAVPLQFQGKLFVTVIEGQNLNFTNPIFQHISTAFESLQNHTHNLIHRRESFLFNKLNFNHLRISMAAGGGNNNLQDNDVHPTQPPANNTHNTEPDAKSGVYCLVTVGEQKLQSKKILKTPNPEWNAPSTLSVFDPFTTVSVSVFIEESVTTDAEARVIGRNTINLYEELLDQKAHEVTLNMLRVENKEVVGSVKLLMQYKYRKTWEPLYKGVTAVCKGDFAPAVALLTHYANNLSPPIPPSMYMLFGFRCRAYCGLGQLDEAYNDAMRVLDIQPDNIEGLIALSHVHMLRHEYQQAEKTLLKAQELAPEDQQVARQIEACKQEALQYKLTRVVQRGYDEFAKGLYEKAITSFSEALEESEQNGVMFLCRALSLLASGQHDGCMEDVAKLTELQPGWPRLAPTLEGSIRKRGEVNPTFKKRWFIVKHCFLFYYKRNHDAQPQGVICLHDVTCAAKGKKEVQIFVNSGKKRVYELKLDNTAERDKWLQCIQKILSTKLALPEFSAETTELKNKRATTSNLVQDVFNKIVFDGLFIPTKVATTIGEKIIASLTTIELEPGDKRGWLYKKGNLNFEKFSRRFFVLKGTTLYYVNTSEDEDLTDSSVFVPAGIIQLEGSTLKSDPEKAIKQYSFEISTWKRRYILSAESKEEYDGWIKAILKITNPQDEPPVVATTTNTTADANVTYKDTTENTVNNNYGSSNNFAATNNTTNNNTTNGTTNNTHGSSSNFANNTTNNTPHGSSSNFSSTVVNNHNSIPVLPPPPRYVSTYIYVPDPEPVVVEPPKISKKKPGMSETEYRYYAKLGLEPPDIIESPSGNPTLPIDFVEGDATSSLIDKSKSINNEEEEPKIEEEKKSCCTIL